MFKHARAPKGVVRTGSLKMLKTFSISAAFFLALGLLAAFAAQLPVA